VEFSR